MFDILNAIESYLKFLLFIKFKFYVNNFLFHWWWWWMYNGHDVMIRIQEIKVWGRSRLICSFLSIVFLKNFLCICSLVLTSKFGYKRQSMRSRLGSLLSFLWSWRSCCAEYSWTRVQLKLDCLGSEAISKFLYGLGEVVVWWIIKLCIHN